MSEQPSSPQALQRRLARIRKRHGAATAPNWTNGCSKVLAIKQALIREGLDWPRMHEDIRLLLRARNDLAVLLEAFAPAQEE